MKKFFLFLNLLLLLSCSVQKRKYQSGFYTHWNSKKVSKNEHAVLLDHTQKEKKPKHSEITRSTGSQTESVDASQDLHSSITKKQSPFFNEAKDSCDIIFFKDGSEVLAKVEEVGIYEIKYKRCDSKDGPLYVTNKADIFMIKYANGNKDLIKSEPPVYTSPVPENTYRSNKNLQMHPAARPALLLSILGTVLVFLTEVYQSLSYMSAGVPAMLSTPFIISLLVGIVSVGLAIHTLVEIHNNPGIYKGKGQAITGLIMGFVLIFISASILLAMF